MTNPRAPIAGDYQGPWRLDRRSDDELALVAEKWRPPGGAARPHDRQTDCAKIIYEPFAQMTSLGVCALLRVRERMTMARQRKVGPASSVPLSTGPA